MSNEREETKYIIVHASDTQPSENLDVEDIKARDRKDGWLSCRFHKVITREGDIQDGRDIKIAGAHIENSDKVSNTNSIGICLVGGKDTITSPL